MPQSGRHARRAASRPVCVEEKNPAWSVDRTVRGTSTIGSHPARSALAVAPHDPPRSVGACRSAIGRPTRPPTSVWASSPRGLLEDSGDTVRPYPTAPVAGRQGLCLSLSVILPVLIRSLPSFVQLFQYFHRSLSNLLHLRIINKLLRRSVFRNFLQ